MKFNIEMHGMEALRKRLKDFQSAIDAFNSEEFEAIKFGSDPESVENAIRQVEARLDECARPFASSSDIKALLPRLKAAYATKIREMADTKRASEPQ